MDSKEVESTVAQFGYYYYGLRRTTALTEDGEYLEVSQRWDDGEPTGEYLDGTCAINLAEREGGPLDVPRALRLLSAYRGDFVLLIGGWKSSPGEDPGEAVIKDAQVLAAWRATGSRIY
jgi:hypothetical protein